MGKNSNCNNLSKIKPKKNQESNIKIAIIKDKLNIGID